MKNGKKIRGRFRVWLLVPGVFPRHTLIYGGDNERIAQGRADLAISEGRAVAYQSSMYRVELVPNWLTV